MTTRRPALRVGIGGPVGSGKTTLVAAICERMRGRYEVAVVTNDVNGHEDARHLARMGAVPDDRIIGLGAGSCLHTTTADGTCLNLAAVDELCRRHGGLDLVLVESGDDTADGTFSPHLADLAIYVIDIAAGEKASRRGNPGITQCDLLVINKTDLAGAVGVSLMNVERDAISVRQDRPHVFTNLKSGAGVETVCAFIIEQGMLD